MLFYWGKALPQKSKKGQKISRALHCIKKEKKVHTVMEAFERFFNDGMNGARLLGGKNKRTKDRVGHNGQRSELVAKCLVWSYRICGAKADDVLSVT